MGAINFKPNSFFKTESIFYNYGDVALDLDPNEEYTEDEIEGLKYLYQESEFENAKSLLDNYSFDFFDVELISGYYEGFQLDITPINERDVLQICEFDDKKREWFINSENLDYLLDHYKNKKDIVELINEEIYTIKRDYTNRGCGKVMAAGTASGIVAGSIYSSYLKEWYRQTILGLWDKPFLHLFPTFPSLYYYVTEILDITGYNQ